MKILINSFYSKWEHPRAHSGTGNEVKAKLWLISLFTGTSWTVIQKRVDGSLDFNQTWDTYANGFGDLNGKYPFFLCLLVSIDLRRWIFLWKGKQITADWVIGNTRKWLLEHISREILKEIPSNVCLETELRPKCFKHYFIKISLLTKAPSKAFQIYTKAKPHEVAVTAFSEPSCNPVILKTTSVFAGSGEPKALCVLPWANTSGFSRVANPLHGWIGWGNTHVPLLIINSKEFVAPSAAQQLPHPEYVPCFSHMRWVTSCLGNILSIAQI